MDFRNIVCCTIAFLLTALKLVCNLNSEIKSYCRESESVMEADNADEYLIVEAEFNSSLVLECRFCDEKWKEPQGMIWYWQDSQQLEPPREAHLDVHNEPSMNRIHTTINSALFIRAFLDEDAGVFLCHGPEGQEAENKYNYRIEPVFEAEPLESIQKGSFSDWEVYQNSNVLPINRQFVTSKAEEMAEIRNLGISLEVITDWGSWGSCRNCTRNHRNGLKASRGHCRVKRHFREDYDRSKDSPIIRFFNNTPLIPCRSKILQEYFPTVSNVTRHLPEFILLEKCKKCKKAKKPKKKFKYKRRYLLAEGGHLTLACPNSSLESTVVWRKDSTILQKGSAQIVHKDEPEPRIMVDIDNIIYFHDVKQDDQGKYTCTVDDVKMLQLKLEVLVKRGILTAALVRHLGYLSFILVFTFLVYCVNLIRICKNRSKFITYDQIPKDDSDSKTGEESKQLLDNE